MAELTEMLIHGVKTPVIKMDTPAAELDKEKALTDLSNVTENARENLGAAPAGFGLGADAVALDSADAKKPNGWYESWFTHNTDADPPNGTHLFRNDMRRTGNGYQTLYGYNTIDGVKRPFNMTRCVLGDERLPWEWVNPPMLLGVEYRTTERYMGKPVYVKLVNGGALPGGSSATISVGADNIENLFIDLGKSLYFQTTNGPNGGYNQFPFESGIKELTASYKRINVTTNGAASANWTVYFYCRYTKTTD